MIMLARKWRPQAFDEVAGQESIVKTIKNAVYYNQVSQAYIFSGPRGSGKTTLARLLAKAMNCLHGPTVNPCNTCASCKEITVSSSIDVIEIDGASNRGIDEVRELREIARYRPTRDKYKIIIIDEVHMLTVEAFNALLKILEEPPLHVIFVFATTELRKVPATIASRCQQFEFKRISEKDLKQRLLLITQAEDIAVTAPAMSMLVRAAEGSLRDALSMLDQLISFAGKNITSETFIALMGFLNTEHRLELTNAILQCEAGKTIELINDFYIKGYDARTIYYDLCTHFRNLLVLISCPTKHSLLNLDENEVKMLLPQMEKSDTLTLIRILNALLDADFYMRQTDQPAIYLEMLLAKVSQYKKLRQIEDLVKQLDATGSTPGNKNSPLSTGFLFDSMQAPPAKKPKTQLEEIDPFAAVPSSPAKKEIPPEKKEPDEQIISSTEAEPHVSIYNKVIANKPIMGSFLISPRQFLLKGDQLTIFLPRNIEFFKNQIESEQYTDVILKASKEVTGGIVKISVVVADWEETSSVKSILNQETPTASKIDSSSTNSASCDNDPLIAKAIELFKGTIKKE